MLATKTVFRDPDIAGAGIRLLACAVIAKAALEAKAGDAGALLWLINEAPMWCEGLGYDLTIETLTAYLKRKPSRRDIRAISAVLRADW